MIQTVRRILSRSSQASIVECRNCGENLEAKTETCPACESTEIVSYNIDS
jgi:primosomal protein N'